eukprot:10744485-Ditylum_brightwellii.AAC.1
MLSLLMPLTCLWFFCIFWWFAADHALMGEVNAATTVTSWWVGAMLEQLWRCRGRECNACCFMLPQ